jgi:hypothetical protein
MQSATEFAGYIESGSELHLRAFADSIDEAERLGLAAADALDRIADTEEP